MKRYRTRLAIAFVFLQVLFSTFILSAPVAMADESQTVGPTEPLAYRMYLPVITSPGQQNNDTENGEQIPSEEQQQLVALLTSRLVVTQEGILDFSIQPTAEEIGNESARYAQILQGLEETNQMLRTGQISLAELGFAIDSGQIAAASASSKIYFTIYRAATKWTVMLEKRQWWGWEFQYTRYWTTPLSMVWVRAPIGCGSPNGTVGKHVARPVYMSTVGTVRLSPVSVAKHMLDWGELQATLT